MIKGAATEVLRNSGQPQEPDRLGACYPDWSRRQRRPSSHAPAGRAAGLVSGTHKHRAETGETYVVVLITQRQQKVR
jgi:hypothetical protein